jgi:hypothetical protein
MDNNIEVIKIAWKADDHVHREKSIDYYWTVSLVSLVLIVLCFIFKNALLGVILFIGTFLYLYIMSRPPKLLDMRITEKSINIDDSVIDIEVIESFRIIETIDGPELILLVKKSMNPRISLPLNQDITNTVRNIMLEKIKEDDKIMPHMGARVVSRFKL